MRMKFESYLRNIANEMKEIKLKLSRIEGLIGEEVLTPDEIKAIKRAEKEIREKKFVTAEQLKKELGIE